MVEDPPPASKIPDEVSPTGDGADESMVAVIVRSLVVMALLEVVLLAGPPSP